MIHLNGNILCVIDCETTGLNQYDHCIWQFTCLPLDFSLNVHEQKGPFDLLMKPTSDVHDSRAITKANYARACIHGFDQEVAANLFHEWYDRLGLGFKKRISVLAHNWPFDREFVEMWLGPDSFDYYFDARYRDTMPLAASIADCCDFKANRIPFTGYTLRAIATALGIGWEDRLAHNSLYDCMKTAEVYKKLIQIMEFIHE